MNKMAVVQDVFVTKRGTIVMLNDPTPTPQIGDVYSCGNGKWLILGVEKILECWGPDQHCYTLLVNSINNSEDPEVGYVLDLEKQ